MPKAKTKKKAKAPKPLFEVTLVSVKTFYVEGESRDDVLSMDELQEEGDFNWRGQFRSEHDETDVRPVDPADASHIRKVHPENIFKADKPWVKK
jgi:hypothetical protein